MSGKTDNTDKSKLLLQIGDSVGTDGMTWQRAAEHYASITGELISGERLRGRYRYASGLILSGNDRRKQQDAILPPKKDDRKEMVAEAKQLQKDLAHARDENEILSRQLEMLRSELRKVPIDFTGSVIRFGVLSDCHMGSLYENLELVEAAYDTFADEGITRVFNCGDLCEGQYTQKRSQHQYEIRVHGYDKQAEYVIENYPRRDGIITEFITGNHDHTFYKIAGADIGKTIDAGRDDFMYHGQMECDFLLQSERGSAVVRMFHPASGSAYAISYRSQKIVESMSGGHKPNVLLFGHTHKAEYMFYMNVHIIQAGTTQFQTPFMRGKHLAAHMGFWIVELTINEMGVAKCKTDWFPDYG